MTDGGRASTVALALSLAVIAGCAVQQAGSTAEELTAGSACRDQMLAESSSIVEGGYVLVHARIRVDWRGTVDAAVAHLDTAMKAIAGLDHVVSSRDEGGEGLRGPDGHTAILQYAKSRSATESIEVIDDVKQAVRDSADTFPDLDIEHFDGASSNWPWRKSPATRASPGTTC